MQTQLDPLLSKLEDSRKRCADDLVGGSAKDYAEYRELVGKIGSYDRSIEIAKDLRKQFINGDYDE